MLVCLAALNVAGTDDHVVVLDVLQKPWDVPGRMGEVTVHLDDGIGAVLQSPVESIYICPAQTTRACAVQHVQPTWVLSG